MAPLPRPVAQVLADVAAGSLNICSAVISPDCVKGMFFHVKAYLGTPLANEYTELALYNITVPNLTPNPANSLGIFESLGDVYSQEDLDMFFASLAP